MKFSILNIVCIFSVYAASLVQAQFKFPAPPKSAPKASLRLCDVNSGTFKFDYIRLNPNPPVKGQKVHIEYGGYLYERVPQGSYINLLINYGSATIVQERYDFCNNNLNIVDRCPLRIGNYSLSTDIEVPYTLLSGDYVVRVDVLTPQSKRVSCLTLKTFLS